MSQHTVPRYVDAFFQQLKLEGHTLETLDFAFYILAVHQLFIFRFVSH